MSFFTPCNKIRTHFVPQTGNHSIRSSDIVFVTMITCSDKSEQHTMEAAIGRTPVIPAMDVIKNDPNI
jgi:hypothetical protein